MSTRRRGCIDNANCYLVDSHTDDADCWDSHQSALEKSAQTRLIRVICVRILYNPFEFMMGSNSRYLIA